MTRATALSFAMLFALTLVFAADTVGTHMNTINAEWADDARANYDLEVVK